MAEPGFREWAYNRLVETGKLMITILSHFLVIAWLFLLVTVGWWIEKQLFSSHIEPATTINYANPTGR